MKLIGSKTSPFVRRLRLLLGDAPYQFEIVDVFSPADRERIAARNAATRIPILEDDGRTLWDSRIITRYLLEKRGEALPSIETELALDAIDNATDTAVALFQIRKFKLDEKWENAYSRNQMARLTSLLKSIDAGPTPRWGTLPATWLYCLLDWMTFREVATLDAYPRLRAFHAAHGKERWVPETDPRK